ncbi:SGNH/GDSL hydrolase family protein [Streptomyces sp. NPDC059009]|uniref:SGNH/GDSL hydrolase family protein n=1 Tax=Streptomyces sp. NPDC059009 TaxID=3346694 RepID=UPI00368C1823
MRKQWITGVYGMPCTVAVLVLGLLLGGCGDPSSGTEAAPAPTAARSDDGSKPPSSTSRERPAPSHPANKATNGASPTVLYLGDSLAMENQKVLGGLLKSRLDARYTSAPYSGTTLCDYLTGTGAKSLVPDGDKAATLVRKLHPDVVVLQFWGNAWGYTPCMDGITYDKDKATYLARYAADAKKLSTQITEAGAGAGRPKVMWVLQGPDAMTPDRVRQVNDIYRGQAASSGDVLADAGQAVSPASGRYTWTETLPCTAYERAHPTYCTKPSQNRTQLHRGDDLLHFCLAPTTPKSRPCPARSPGVLRMAQAITGAVAKAS